MKKTLIMALSVAALSAQAQNNFTYDDIAGGMFNPKTVYGVRSTNDGEHYTTQEGGKIVRYSYRTGEAVEILFECPEGMHGFSGYSLSGDERKLLLATDDEPIYRHSFRAAYKVYDRDSGALTDLSAGGKQQSPLFSPDGTKVAFVRDNDLYYTELATMTERRVTADGEFNRVINGLPDWVYEEEFTFSRAFEWSPRSDRIAFLRFDESRVKQFDMNLFENNLYPRVYTFKYPKAGEENSVVTAHVYDLSTGRTLTVDTGGEPDQYLPRIKWTADGEVAVYRLNRRQNEFDLLTANPRTGSPRIIYKETNDRYVDRVDDETITFLSDGCFVVRSEKDGFFHLYLHNPDGAFIRRLTSGEWEVTTVYGADEDQGVIYYLSTEGSELRRNLWKVHIETAQRERITTGEGFYRIAFSEGFRYFISYFTNLDTPNTVTLHRSDGEVVRVLEDNAELKSRILDPAFPRKAFFRFTAADGVTPLNGWILAPAGFDGTGKWPVLLTQYSGPGSQRVMDAFSVDWEYALVNEGYVVICVDGRGTGFRGEDFKKITYRQLGKYEAEDQIAVARQLTAFPWVDGERIGIYGWSYGGFMALNCILKGADVFKAAVAVAPVTNWRYYDTIYTELYNGLPDENPSGYDQNSPIFFADLLQGKLLIAHGTGDDNVHVQNTYEMIDRLVANDKEFEMYIYPDKNHAMAPGGRKHLMNRIIGFLKREL